MYNAIAHHTLTDAQPFPKQGSHRTWTACIRLSCAGPLALLCFRTIQVFRRIWNICFPFSNTSVVIPDVVMLSRYCRCSGASPCSREVWISPWQMVGLCFQPWGSQFQVDRTNLHVKVKYGLHTAVRGMEKNALAILWHSAWLPLTPVHTEWNSSMDGTAALSSGWTSFRSQKCTVIFHSQLQFCTVHMGLLKVERILLIIPWLSSQWTSSWMGIRESLLVQYCLRCTVVVAIGICCSWAINTSTAERSCERVGKVDNCFLSSVSKTAMP